MMKRKVYIFERKTHHWWYTNLNVMMKGSNVLFVIGY